MAGNWTRNGILVDTSVWIALFRDAEPHAEALTRILKEGRVVTTGIVKAELLQGVKNAKEGQRVLGVLDAVESVEITEKLWLNAGWLASDMRKRGLTVPLTDAALGALAIDYDLSLYTLDRHFDAMPGLRRYQWSP
jgi:predicted nucleic acid-binding protein